MHALAISKIITVHKETQQMAEDNFTLTTFYASWKEYQDHLAATLAPLTDEQLTLRAAPGLRSVGENAMHIVGCRMFWFTEALEVDGGEELKAYASWNKAALELGSPVPSATELAQAIDRTWRLMSDCLARWSPADMRKTISDEEDGEPVEISRAWVVWHVLEHDLHHGGELSFTLGMHGIPAEFAI